MPNIEIKAHCPKPAQALATAKRLATQHLGQDHQIDTYFKTHKGRLKLRESSLSGAYLIPYLRPDGSGPKRSDYALLPCQDADTTKRLFSEMLGVEAVVDKRRDIYLIGNVRVHLDEIQGLGSFIEFEAVYDKAEHEAQEYEKVRALLKDFGIAESDLLKGSYREMVMEK